MLPLPPFRIDPTLLPPPIMTSDPGSFAHYTLKVRVPAILRETIELNAFPPAIQADLEVLHAELTGGKVRGLCENTSDRLFWNQVSAPYIGRSWLEVPWYWAEAFFYRRVLEATRYFQPGPWQGFDPYAVKKQAEWEPNAAPATVTALLDSLPPDTEERFYRLLHASLWGNRADLSYAVAAHLGSTAPPHTEQSNLLIDDSAALFRFLRLRPCRRIALIADNAGTELLMDLALSDFLLAEGLAQEVTFHLKPQPFFVSDAMVQDVIAGMAALKQGGPAAQALGQRLTGYLADERLRLATHWLYATSLFYFQLPDDLYTELAAMDLVVVKGDANYRRLLGDAHWPPMADFGQLTAYFPAPLVALRTFKSELVVGLRPGQAEQLQAEDPEWLVNGRRGVIQARLERV